MSFKLSDLGSHTVNPHTVGVIMKEAVRRAIFAIRSIRFSFDVTQKRGYGGDMDDLFTEADTAGQRIYMKMLQEHFPRFGVIAEEDELRIQSQYPGHNIYFTVDPLDGTKAFVRRQSDGIGTMIALVCDGRVLAAHVGDIMTQEMYGFRPDSNKVHRISEFGISEHLSTETSRPAQLKKKYVLLRDLAEDYSDFARRFIGRFGGANVTSGSIGTFFAKLWKREVSGIVLRPGFQTPWDLCPIYGISQALGYQFLSLSAKDGALSVFDATPFLLEKGNNSDEIIVVKNACAKDLLRDQPLRQ